jgi:Kef-type K+ transport system membrane component KefB
MLLSLSIVLVAGLALGRLAQRLGQPAVLGELLGGLLLGAVPALHSLRQEPALATLSQLGVLVLLFQVGLESSVRKMWSVGGPALRVAVLGVAAPMVLGYGVGVWLMPEQTTHVHVFLGAALAATSVGITARVLKDLRRADAPEARVILGAAVIDDVLGLMVLATVTGAGGALLVTAKAVGFLAAAIGVGLVLAPRFRTHPVPALAFCFVLAWAAGAVGLSPIVGAFTAGLVIQSEALERSMAPIVQLLAPFFFVQMGLSTDAGGLFGALPIALTAAAIAGKLFSGLAVKRDRLAVGIGMVPRGEVGLVFATTGVLDPRASAAVVAMVLLTTLATPPALKWRLRA